MKGHKTEIGMLKYRNSIIIYSDENFYEGKAIEAYSLN